MKIFPVAYLSVAAEVPQKIKASLHQTARIACGNLLELPGSIVIGPDTTGSSGLPSNWMAWSRQRSWDALLQDILH